MFPPDHTSNYYCTVVVGGDGDIEEDIQNDDSDNIYYIGIRQKDKSPIADWDWLMNATSNNEAGYSVFYFETTLNYVGPCEEKLGEESNPLFEISDIKAITPKKSITDEEESSIPEDDTEGDFEVAAPESIDYETIYNDTVASIYTNATVNEGYADYFLQIAFYDMDGDGILELIVQHGTGEADMLYEVYTTDGTVVTKVGEIGGGHTSLFEDAEGNLYTDYCQMGYEVINCVYIYEGELVEENIFDGNAGEYMYADTVLQTPVEMFSMDE